MHTLIKITMSDLEATNKAINGGQLERLFQQTTKLLASETSFYFAENGYRTALFLCQLNDSSMIPQIAEPFFNELNAKVEFFPGMNQDEMVKGVALWREKTEKSSSLDH